MTAQPTLFDNPEIAKRDVVLAEMGLDHKAWLDVAREKARRYCRMNSGIKYHHITGEWCNATTDDVRLMMGVTVEKSKENNRMGSVFLHPDFKWTGYYWKSRAFGSHGNEIKIWRLSK